MTVGMAVTKSKQKINLLFKFKEIITWRASCTYF
jgi:hypothetical protein